MSKDELTLLKGIDREIEERLRDQYPTYESLADADSRDYVEALDPVLVNVNLGLVCSWPEQAKLAAAGKMVELAEKQATLSEWNGGPFDDLTRIKGIDTDMQRYLRENTYERLGGVPTYESLAGIDPHDIAEVIGYDTAEANSDLLDSWAKQATLAAAARDTKAAAWWDVLEKYQAGLPEWEEGMPLFD